MLQEIHSWQSLWLYPSSWRPPRAEREPIGRVRPLDRWLPSWLHVTDSNEGVLRGHSAKDHAVVFVLSNLRSGLASVRRRQLLPPSDRESPSPIQLSIRLFQVAFVFLSSCHLVPQLFRCLILSQPAFAIRDNSKRCLPGGLAKDFKNHDRVAFNSINNSSTLVSILYSQFVAPRGDARHWTRVWQGQILAAL